MHSYRGRGGPRQSTPANVQCQKCLKRDKSIIDHFIANIALTPTERHYSYECKEPAQTRPYVSRPSRTQQLRNPKLMPKLTNETPDDAERKKGIADAELAKKEAERARKRELEERDDELIRKTESKRQRSESVDSVSTISTSRSASPPPPRRRSPSPVPSGRRQRSTEGRKPSRPRSFSPESEDGRPVSRRSGRSRHTQSPPRRRQRSVSRDSHSPPGTYERKYRERDEDRVRPAGRSFARNPSDSRESSISRDGGAGSIRRSLSRSPDRRGARGGGRLGRGGGRNSGYRDGPEARSDRAARNERQERRQEQSQPERERSLSPFSKRLALTQSLNTGR
ncbi:hypothetical protein ColTof4_00855 [Colletotrichum tofieldiae]|uniref:Uncharacterized protein n=1 Tax=Colletotrichum tofieldiae TaxID=708197 RepID=A0A166S5K1_9PEZI|nr:hypothetical protein CT0861_02490 [Colletotrichum tofieldiae]GKT60731.1 hypothetical protein ColTof3_08070 [Colletotrichum tofieldiae]GKT68432.1 hypothetical protein ColTof4_00855 [Colletotrichum tofieldiae]